MRYTARAVKGRRKDKYRHRFTINVIHPNFFLENENEKKKKHRMSKKRQVTS